MKAGDRIIWREHGEEHTGIIEADSKYVGGLKVGGRSLNNIRQSAEWVRVVTFR